MFDYVAVKTDEGPQSAPLLSVNDAINKIEVGRFHGMLLLLCGLAFMSDAMEVTLLSYISFCAAEEWNLSGAQTASISSAVFLGITAGNLFFGYIADRYGRRKSFVLGNIILVAGGFLTAAAPDYWSLLVLRGLVGFGIGSSPVPFDILAEFLPDSTRARYLMYIEYFWTLGTLFVSGMAWLFLTTYGWRSLVLVTTLPVLLALLLSSCLLPESPRWLMTQQQPILARNIIISAIETNRQIVPSFSLKLVETKTEARTDIFSWESLWVIGPLYLVWFVLGLSYYGVILFLSKLFRLSNSTDSKDDRTCYFEYKDLFFSASFEILGVMLAVYVLRRNIRGVWIQSFFYALTGLCVLIMGQLPVTSFYINTALASIARMSIMISSCLTWVITPEFFQTSHRSFGHSLAVAVSRLGAFSSPYLVNAGDLSLTTIGSVLCAALSCAALVGLMLPPTYGFDGLDDD